ncbi:unnamed protein product [Effrenium voratum]|nr:unnamed protein product [Effrenium voratum]
MAAHAGRCLAARPAGESAPCLPAAAYARLLRQLGRGFASGWLGLAASGTDPPCENLAAALVQELCSAHSQETFDNVASALIAVAQVHGAEVAGALQKASENLPLQVAFSLLLALLQDACSEASEAMPGWAPLAVSLAPRALQDPRGAVLPRQLLQQRLERHQAPEKGAWLQVLEILGDPPPAGGEDPEPWQLSLHPKAEVSEELRAFWPIRAAAKPAKAEVAERKEGAQGTLQVDLYANPAAKAAQDAVVAALAPARRCEALLSSARAEAPEETFPALLGAWREAPEACAARGLEGELLANAFG